MSQSTFGERVKNYLKAAGSSQKILANRLGLDRSLLTHKLNATGRTVLTHPEVKQIVKALVALEAITTRAEALELLAEANCSDFSREEWQTGPLKELDREPSLPGMAGGRPSFGTATVQAVKTEHGNQPLSLSTLTRPRHNLPVQLTSFIGREQEIEQVKHLLVTTRLLTLTGAGGVGKTRLALQVGTALLEDFREGVWLVELVPLTEPGLVGQAIAQALGLRLEPDRLHLDTLVDYLKPRQLLLILDNCEHLIDACAALSSELLSRCPELSILATSRETLEIYGEVTYPVPSLSLPELAGREPGEEVELEHITRFEAVRLFVERAAAAHPGFRISKQNASAVAQVCYHLDGIPLAIELAAARINYLSIDQILDNLDDRFRLLKGDSRATLPRHKTLRALIDWSYYLLTRPEQLVLDRLAVFAGSFTLDEAEEISAGIDPGESEILDYLISLVRKSLLQAEECTIEKHVTVRYRMLETIRQYGLEKLREAREDYQVRLKLIEYFRDLTLEAEAKINGAEQLKWLNRLEQEHDNLKAVMAWALANGLGEAALEIASALRQFWNIRGYWVEGRRWVETALEAAGNAPDTLRAKGLEVAGWLAAALNDAEPATILARQSRELFQSLGDKRGQAYALSSLAYIALDQNNLGRSLELAEESLALLKEVDDKWYYVVVLDILGYILDSQGKAEEAQSCFEEGLTLSQELANKNETALFNYQLGRMAENKEQLEPARRFFTESARLYQEVGNRWGLSAAFDHLGVVEMYFGNYEHSRRLQEESLELNRKINDQDGQAVGLRRFGLLMLFLEDYASATKLFKQSLALGQKFDKRDNLAACLEGLGYLAWRSGNPEKAARLLGTAEAFFKRVSKNFLPDERLMQERFIKEVKIRLQENAHLKKLLEGEALSVEEVLALALEDEQEVDSL